MPPIQFATIATVNQAVLDLMVGAEPTFWAIGINLFQAFATISLVWFGISWALHGRHDQMVEFATLLLKIAFAYAMATFYASPIPGIGQSFSNLAPSMGQYLANILDARALQQTFYHLDALASKFVAPGALEVLQNILYWTLLVLLALSKAVTMGIVLVGLMAVAITVLIGGVFVPFFIVPVRELEYLFWGWLRYWIAASFVQVVAMAYILIYSRFLDHFVITIPSGIETSQFPLYGMETLVIIAMFTFAGPVIVYSVVNNILHANVPALRVPGL